MFAQVQARRVTTGMVASYIRTRQEQGAANATINREVTALKRAFNLALWATQSRITVVPRMPMLKEDNVRKNFIEHAQYLTLATHASELWLRTLLELGWRYGWRLGELQALRVRQVNLQERTIRLDVGTTKNREGREVSMTTKVHQLLTECCHGKRPEDYVLTHADDGKPVRDVRWAWQNMCLAAGLATLVCKQCGTAAAKMSNRCPQCRALRKLKYTGADCARPAPQRGQGVAGRWRA